MEISSSSEKQEKPEAESSRCDLHDGENATLVDGAASKEPGGGKLRFFFV